MSITKARTPAAPRSMVNAKDFARLEDKVDKLTEVISRMVIVEERQTNTSGEIKDIWNAIDLYKVQNGKDVEANKLAISQQKDLLAQWINRGLGAWGIAGVIFLFIQFGARFIGAK